MCWRRVRVSTQISIRRRSRAARFTSIMPVQPRVSSTFGSRASMRVRSAAPWASMDTSFGLSVRATTSRRTARHRSDTSVAPRSRSAVRRSSTPETMGTKAARRSCSAFTAFSVQRRCDVSNGRCVVIRRISVMSPASLRRSEVERASPAGFSASRIQCWASRTALSRRATSIGPNGCGSTRLCTTVAHVMPSRISSTRARAMSKMAAGSLTAGKAMRPAV